MRCGFCVPRSGVSVPAFDVPSFLFQCSGFSVSAFRVQCFGATGDYGPKKDPGYEVATMVQSVKSIRWFPMPSTGLLREN